MVKWDDFKKSIKDSGIIINLMYYKSTFEDSNKLYDDIANLVSNLLERPINEGKIPNIDDSIFNSPTFDLSHEENLICLLKRHTKPNPQFLLLKFINFKTIF